MELAFCINKERPLPPFKLGTQGFMSPEQQCIALPTIMEDIYGLGALMILLFTGLSPIKFNTGTANSLIDDLLYFTNSRLISGLISACLAENREHRPSLMEVVDVLKQYRGLASINGELLLAKNELKNPQREEMLAFVEKAIA